MTQRDDSYKELKILVTHRVQGLEYVLKVLSNFIGVHLVPVEGDKNIFDLVYGDGLGMPSNTPRIPVQPEYSAEDIPLAEDFRQILDDDESSAAPLFPFDIIAATRFWLLDSAHENVDPASFDEHRRLKATSSLQKRLGVLEKPLVNRYGLLFADWIEKHFNIKTRLPLPQGYKAAVILSHDVDQVDDLAIQHRLKMLKRATLKRMPLEVARRLAGINMQMAKKFSGFRDNFWLFPQIMEMEKSLGVRSTFFFASRSNVDEGADPALDVPYSLDDEAFAPLFENMKKDDFEIGLHASYKAHASAKELAREKKLLEKAAKTKIKGLRHHFWHLDYPFWQSLKNQSQAGFEYDSSLGFNDRPGLRLSCAWPFNPYDPKTGDQLDCVQIPTGIMDGNYFYNKGVTKDDAVTRALEFVVSLKRHRGVMALDWHNRTSYPGNRSYMQWALAYKEIISALAADPEIFVGSFEQFIDALPDNPSVEIKEDKPSFGKVIASDTYFFDVLRGYWAKHDTRYKDESIWQKRMFESPTGKTVGVTALADGKWAGGFLTIPMPLRSPTGKKLHGGKMEVMITSPDFRGKTIEWEEGGTEKASVMVSRALIGRSMESGFEVIFGIPTVPAFRAHKPAGHGVIVVKRRPMILVLDRSFDFDADNSSIKRMAGKAFWAGQFAARRFDCLSSSFKKPERVDYVSADIEKLDDKLAHLMPSVTLQRRADYLNWRFGGDKSAVMLELRKKGELKGFLMGRLPKKPGGRAVLGDLLVEPKNYPAALALVGKFSRIAKDAGAAAISYMSYGSGKLGTHQRKMLSACGFVQYSRTANEHWIVDAGNGEETADYLLDSDWSANGLFLDI